MRILFYHLVQRSFFCSFQLYVHQTTHYEFYLNVQMEFYLFVRDLQSHVRKIKTDCTE